MEHNPLLNLDVSPKTVRVTLELDLVDGVHFNPEDKYLTKDEMRSEAVLSFIDWIDSWCGEDSKDNLQEYIQTKLI